jgi:hypothetical protein
MACGVSAAEQVLESVRPILISSVEPSALSVGAKRNTDRLADWRWEVCS